MASSIRGEQTPAITYTLALVTDQIMAGAEPTYSPGSAAGVLLLHDLAGSPQVFHGLAQVLSDNDLAVDVPLLPGHGTDLEDLDEMTWDDWAAAAQLALDELASRTGPVVVGGIGMGATLAAFVAAQHPSAVGIAAINPRAMPVPADATRMLEAMLADGCTRVPPLGHDVSDRSVRVVEYETVTVRTLICMFQALEDMAEHWSEIQCPVLLVTSERDHRVSPYNAQWLADRLSGEVTRVSLPNSFHLAPVDVDHAQLEAAFVDFVLGITSSQAGD
jgi:carboxylesterase